MDYSVIGDDRVHCSRPISTVNKCCAVLHVNAPTLNLTIKQEIHDYHTHRLSVRAPRCGSYDLNFTIYFYFLDMAPSPII